MLILFFIYIKFDINEVSLLKGFNFDNNINFNIIIIKIKYMR